MTSLFSGLMLALLLSMAAWLDIRQRRIPNLIAAAVALLGLGSAMAGGILAGAGALATALAVLSVGVGVWKLGWLGGGDVKLIAALSLWAGPSYLAELLLAIALGGGALALVIGAARHPAVAPMVGLVQFEVGRRSPARSGPGAAVPMAAGPVSDRDLSTIPYGVAVAFGGAWLLYRWFQV